MERQEFLPSPVPKQLLWKSESGASIGLVNESRQSIVHEAVPGIKYISLMKPFKCTLICRHDKSLSKDKRRTFLQMLFRNVP